jgi:hypothetical protein
MRRTAGFMSSQAPSHNRHVAELSTLGWRRSLVVSAEQEDQPVAVGMAEDAQQDPLGSIDAAGFRPAGIEHLLSGEADAELEQAIT